MNSRGTSDQHHFRGFGLSLSAPEPYPVDNTQYSEGAPPITQRTEGRIFVRPLGSSAPSYWFLGRLPHTKNH